MKFLASCILLTISIFCFSIGTEETPPPTKAPSNSSELYNMNMVWNIHFHFDPAGWENITPLKVGGIGPGGIFSHAFIAKGDNDGDLLLSRDEFINLGKLWYREWSSLGAVPITQEVIDNGFGNTLDESSGGKLVLAANLGERNGIAAVLGVEFPDSYTSLEFADLSYDSVSIRHKGNGTFLNAQRSGKYSYKLDINDGYPGRKLGGAVKLNLHNCITDPSYMNEVLTYKLYREAGVPAPRTSYARLYRTVDGQNDKEYIGLYSIVENVDKHFLSDRFGSKKGAIFKPVTPFLFKDLGTNWNAYSQIYDPKTNVNEEEKWRLIDLCRLVTNATDEEFEARIGYFIDLDEFARYLAINVLVSDLDGILGPGQNFYLHLNPESNKFVFIPWDQDHSFGMMKRTQLEREMLSIFRPWDNNNPFLERMFNVVRFKQAYLTSVQEINSTLFNADRISKQVDSLAMVLQQAVEEESAEKLELFNKMVNWDASKDETLVEEAIEEHGNPGLFGAEEGVKPIKGFVVRRNESVEDQLAGRSKGLEDRNKETIGDFTKARGMSDFFTHPMDQDLDGILSEEEFSKGFQKWFELWHEPGKEFLTGTDVRIGINKEINALTD